MKINEGAFAKASAIFTAGLYVICYLLVRVFPGFFKIVTQSWIHALNLESIWTGQAGGNLILGFISSILGAWIAGHSFAWIYNKFIR